MKMALKLFAATGFLSLASAGTAIAQQPPAPIWSGFYAGVYGGVVSASSTGTLSHNDPTTPGVTAATMFGAGVDQSFSPSGGTGGLALGYNWQPGGGMFVFGVEADMAWVGATASKTVTSTDTLTTWSLNTKLYSLGTLRGLPASLPGPCFGTPPAESRGG